MIHGIISDGTFFQESASLLSRCFKTITYDRRGYGKNTKIPFSDYSIPAQAEDAAAILRETAGEPAWILGNSAGGLIGLEVALCHPELIRGLVLLEPSLGYDPAERAKLQAWNQELNKYRSEGRIKRALPAFSRVIGGGGDSAPASLTEIRQTYQNLHAFMYGELNEVQNYLPPPGQFQHLEIPVTIAISEKGKNSIFASSSRAAADLIGWPVRYIPGYHNVAKDMPREFSESLCDIIRDCDERASRQRGCFA